MLIEHEGRSPRVHPTAQVAPTAVLSGDVRLGAECRVLFGAVLTDDGGEVELGERCIVMENALLRGRDSHPLRIGDHVIVGPHAHLNGAQIGDDAFIATGASVFSGASVGARAEVRIGGVVHVNSALPDGGLVPIGWVAVGDPAEALPPDRHEDIWAIQRTLDFSGTVFGATEPAEIARRYTELFGRHRGDRVFAEP